MDTDWQSFLLPDSEIPSDVCFLVKDETTAGENRSFRAHKLLLAGSSPVFRAQFFGPMKDTGEVFEVKDISTETFDIPGEYRKGCKGRSSR